ncbi:MAG: hypothetical protein V2A66_06875 [Pseudomonadota bacterium]
MKLTFTPPSIIGVLCTDEREIPQALLRVPAKCKGRIAILPFVVEKKHLRNTVACMKLMDIAGLFVLGSHSKDIIRHLPSVDAAARRSKRVDAVVRRGRRFIGTSLPRRDLMGLFCQTCLDILTNPSKAAK